MMGLSSIHGPSHSVFHGDHKTTPEWFTRGTSCRMSYAQCMGVDIGTRKFRRILFVGCARNAFRNWLSVFDKPISWKFHAATDSLWHKR